MIKNSRKALQNSKLWMKKELGNKERNEKKPKCGKVHSRMQTMKE
jgi:hypothetical protein